MASKEANDWLGARLAEQRKEVEAAEARLQQYREQNETISLVDRDNITVQKLGDLNAAVTRAKTDRLTKEAMYRQLQASASDRARLDTAPQILGNPFIQQQKAELATLQQQAEQASGRIGKKHPDMIKLTSAIQMAQAKLTSEIEKIVQSVRSEYQAALTQENSLVAALNQQKTEALAMNRKSIAYSVLERDVESSTQLYNNLLQRTKETGVTGELRTSNIRVVDAAEKPRAPVSPKRARNELLALFLGTLFACVLVAFFEYMDNRIKSPDEIRAHLGLTHLGMLPVAAAEGGPLPADQRWRPGELQRGAQDLPDQRALLVGGGRRPCAGRHEHRPARGQEPGVQQPRHFARPGGPAHAADRCRHAQAEGARHLRPQRGAGPLERAGRRRADERGGAGDDGARAVRARGGPNPAEPD